MIKGNSPKVFIELRWIGTKGGVGLGDVWLVEKAELSFQKSKR